MWNARQSPDPGGVIYDAHHHFWRYNDREYGWIDATMSVLRSDFLPSDLEREILHGFNSSVDGSPDDKSQSYTTRSDASPGHASHIDTSTGGAAESNAPENYATESDAAESNTRSSVYNVTGTVAVQARQNLDETRWLIGIAGKYDFIKGVVGWVDLCSEGLDEELDEFAGNPWLVGVRHVIHDEPDDDFMLRQDFLRGIEKLSRYRLTYDLLLQPRHLKKAASLAGMFPDQKFVLNHLGKPFIRDGRLDPWREDLESLAACPNVWCKISGMVTEADWKRWRSEDFIPYIAAVLEAFGSDRIMLGSDWPVCLLAGSYNEVMKIPLRYLEALEAGDREKIFRKNCMDFYELTS